MRRRLRDLTQWYLGLLLDPQMAFADHLFAEGVTVLGNRLIQLLWNSDTALVLDKATLTLIQIVQYGYHGWGITNDGRTLILSDGTETLRFLDPETFEEVGHLRVLDRGAAVAGLNELEFVRGHVYANVFPTSRIAVISRETGQVVSWMDLGQALSRDDRRRFPVGVLNGIAYDTLSDRLFVTGKLWPRLLELRLRADLPSCTQLVNWYGLTRKVRGLLGHTN